MEIYGYIYHNLYKAVSCSPMWEGQKEVSTVIVNKYKLQYNYIIISKLVYCKLTLLVHPRWWKPALCFWVVCSSGRTYVCTHASECVYLGTTWGKVLTWIQESTGDQIVSEWVKTAGVSQLFNTLKISISHRTTLPTLYLHSFKVFTTYMIRVWTDMDINCNLNGMTRLTTERQL